MYFELSMRTWKPIFSEQRKNMVRYLWKISFGQIFFSNTYLHTNWRFLTSYKTYSFADFLVYFARDWIYISNYQWAPESHYWASSEQNQIRYSLKISIKIIFLFFEHIPLVKPALVPFLQDLLLLRL